MNITGSSSIYRNFPVPAAPSAKPAAAAAPMSSGTTSPSDKAVDRDVIDTQETLAASLLSMRSFELSAGLAFTAEAAVTAEPGPRLAALGRTRDQMQGQLTSLGDELNRLRQAAPTPEGTIRIRAIESQFSALAGQMRDARTELTQLQAGLLARNSPAAEIPERRSPATEAINTVVQILSEALPGPEGAEMSSACLEALTASGNLEASEARVELRNVEISAMNERVATETEALAETTRVFESTTERADGLGTRIAAALAAAEAGLRLEASGAAAEPEPEEMAGMNEALASFGVTMARSPEGQMSYLVDERSVDAGSFWQQVRSRVGRENEQLQALRAQIPVMLNDVRRQAASLRDTSASAAALSTQAEAEQLQYDRDRAGLDLAMGRMQALMADKNMLAALPAPAMQALSLATGLLEAQASRSRERAPQLRQQLAEGRTRLGQVLTAGREQLERSLASVQQAAGRLSALSGIDQALNQLNEKISARPQDSKLAAQQAKLAQRVADLIHEADELAARLELAPKTGSADVSVLIGDLLDVLVRNRELFDEFDQSNSRVEIINQRIDWEYLGKVRESNRYHSRKLTEISELNRTEAVDEATVALEYLQDSLTGLNNLIQGNPL